MDTTPVWRLLLVWAAGLALGPWLPHLVRLGLLLAALLALRPAHHPLLRRVGALLVWGVLATLVGAHCFAGPWGGRASEPRGLGNPGFRPLPLTVAERWAPEAAVPERAVAQDGEAGLRALEEAVLMGRRERLPPDWQAAFRAAGLAHLLAVSGLHLGVLVGLLVGLLRLLQCPRRLTAGLGTLALGLYVSAVGAPPSALRAGLMTAFGLLYWGSGRRIAPGRVLPAALLTLLVTVPSLLASAAFCLSAGATLGITLALRGSVQRRQAGWRERSLAFLRVSLGAQAGVLPSQLWFFGVLHPWGPLVNVLAVPLAGLWLPAVVVARALGPLGGLPAAVARAWADGLGALLTRGAVLASGLPGAVVPVPAWVWLPAALGLLAWVRGGGSRIVALVLLALTVASPLLDDGRPRLTFLAVGQGDALVVETRSPRRTLVFDTGPAWGDWDAGRDVILPYLRSRGVRRIDLLVLSHPDADHIGGAAALLLRLPTTAMVTGDWPENIPGTPERMEAARRRAGVPRTTLRAGDVVGLGGGDCLEVLAGAEQEVGPARYESGWNDRSLVVRLLVGGLSVLLPGDLEQSGEERLRPHWGRLRSTVLKVSHHGSGGATSSALLAAVAPRLAVVSVGRSNRYGHPDPSVLDRLATTGVRIHRTDRQGALWLRPAGPFTGLDGSVPRPILTDHKGIDG